jgi:GT2 family glycosyltransferase
MKVSIIITLHNRADMTWRCLQALQNNTDYPDWELVLVDNGSSDETPGILKSLEGEVKILRSETNLGFAKGNNWGVKSARGDLLCFLNNDTEVQKGWLSALVEWMNNHPEAMVVGGKLLFPDGTIQHAGVIFDKVDRLPYHIYRGFSANAKEVNRERKLIAVTGACMLVKKWAFDYVGGFDEGYVNGFEDIDLCLKLGQIGGEVYYTPTSAVIHHTSATPGRKDFDIANAEHFRRKWFDKIVPDEDSFLAEDGYYPEWRGNTLILRKQK